MTTRVRLIWEGVRATESSGPSRGGTREKPSLYAPRMVDAAFGDPNLIVDAGLVPLIALAEQVGLADLVPEHLAIVDADNAGVPTRTPR